MQLSRSIFPKTNKVGKAVLFSALSYFSCQQALAAGAPQPSELANSVASTQMNTSGSVVSVPKAELQTILNKVTFFNADFNQEIKDYNGQLIGTGSGTFSVLKPNYLYWLTKMPDESVIVADGDAVWLYDPFIEQASVYKLTASIANTPILLLTTSDKQLWDKFTVNKVSDLTYNISANDSNSQIKTLNLVFSQNKNLQPQKQLASFSMEDATGQISTISLSNVDYMNRPADELFQFTLPDGAYLDDQR